MCSYTRHITKLVMVDWDFVTTNWQEMNLNIGCCKILSYITNSINLGKIIKNRNRPAQALLLCLETETTTMCFHKIWEFCWDTQRLIHFYNKFKNLRPKYLNYKWNSFNFHSKRVVQLTVQPFACTIFCLRWKTRCSLVFSLQ